MATGTVRLHRVFRTTPEKVYRAFLDPEAMAKWLPPHGFTGKVHQMDARVGGTYRMSFTNFSTGKSHAFGGKCFEQRADQRPACRWKSCASTEEFAQRVRRERLRGFRGQETV